ncbi:uncharacterized protein LOC122403788 [Colletes gigas]|uniref:uncharacterized protein LOC122403788 n=1 Tax=Colletes gigas TaxID=935657 RepID=UPI001C9B5584|nr:uncharacterized protein LOC122403788 [Colletes gigas]
MNEAIYYKFESIQSKIESAVAETQDEAMHAAFRDTFETTYFDLMAKVEGYISRSRASTQPSPSPSTTSAPTELPATPRLPTIVLPEFDGDYNNWLRFRDTFVSLIHQNVSLCNIQRFHYLNSALKGSAARVIRSLGVSDENYRLAWETLKNRYEDPKSLIYHHGNALLNLQSVHKQTHTTLRDLVDNANNHVLALGALGQPTKHWDTLLVLILSRKLDVATQREWEKRSLRLTEIATFRNFVEFVEEQAKYLERAPAGRQPAGSDSRPLYKPPGHSKPQPRTDYVASHVANMQTQCILCKREHSLQHCEKLKGMPHSEMHATVKQLQVCFNCLQQGHQIKNCTRGSCRKCGKRHNTLLHRDQASVSAGSEPFVRNSESVAPVPTPATSCVSNLANNIGNHAVLSTAIVYLEDNKGTKHECCALLDAGSQAHFITEALCNRLRLPRSNIEMTVGGLGRTVSSTRSRAQVAVSSRHNNFRANVSCLVLKTITEDMPNVPIDRTSTSCPPGMQLADPNFAKSKQVDLLIGAGLFWQLLCIGQQKAGTEGLIWQKTRLGWVLGGQLNSTDRRTRTSNCYVVSNEQLDTSLARFWELENVTSDKDGPLTDATNDAEQHFRRTTRRDDDGRYLVSIPFTNSINQLGDSRAQAEKRFAAIERKLARQPDLRREYISFMHEYERLGHMTRRDTATTSTTLRYYLPHHAVFKASSTTTRVRIVFDGSAKTSSGLSLNDIQLVGPTVQDDLFSIVVRFRKHKFVLSADVEKMYRQVLVRPEDRKYQCILWRSCVDGPINTYELNTVTYGTSSAPFLATRVLHQIGLECADQSPLASRAIIYDFYVDDLLTGCETVRETQALKKQLTQVLGQAGFQLRKWASNKPEILHDRSSIEKEIKPPEGDSKTLGLIWLSEPDELRFSVREPIYTRITKRTILSEIAQVFDPLGLVGPVITRAKILMQTLWQLQLGWDESVDQDLHAQWSRFRTELNQVKTLEIPRRVICDNARAVELHGFSDASEKAYGACIYLRSLDETGRYTVRLLCAKSRVAPLKTTTLPRLELCGALLLAQLVKRIRYALQLAFKCEHYWSDSIIALAWIRGQPNRWKTFVANRVSEIRQSTSVENWHHVASEDNPADVISRGTDPTTLRRTDLWWSGPSWLLQEQHEWPSIETIPDTMPEEINHVRSHVATPNCPTDILCRFSSYSRLVRIVAYCRKFVDRLKSKTRENSQTLAVQPNATNSWQSFLTARELARSEETIIKLVQQECFGKEISDLQAANPLAQTSKLASLNPFLDSKGLLRVGGRLRNAPIVYNQKHPLILPSDHPLTNLVVTYEHCRLLHAGCQLTSASLRNRFWILACKRVVKKIIHRCIRCFRTKATGINPIMGDLPATRVTPARPFATCGIDYAGPLLIRERGRARTAHKAYICIFVCFVTKAVHIELATDLSTDAFLNCLNRFIARRGRSHCIYSDNGRNFIGARNNLNELGVLLNSKEHHAKVGNLLAQEQIQWHLIPPHAPHFGGLWESAVKSAKHHVKRIIGEQRLTYEELYTILAQIEACLNSRPLHPLSSDPNDLTPLTPGHFLIGDALTALPQQDLLHLKQNRLNRHQLVQQMLQHFWKRWQQQYLHHLQQRQKWRLHSPTIVKIGALVVIREDNIPPLRWRLGRITELQPGTDGIIRVVSIKVSDGIIKRPVTRICLLPLAEEEDAAENTPGSQPNVE